MDNIDGYLSRLAQKVWPSAIVMRKETGEGFEFRLERDDQEPVGLGTDFRNAKAAIEALRRREEDRRAKP